MRAIWKLFLKIRGWKVQEDFPHHLPKYILLVAPHTSSWDFIIGLAARSVVGLQHVRFLAKAELFKPPFGWIFRMLGGYPVNRTGKHQLVAEVVALFRQHERFAIVIAPEGTRKRVERLKTGFYHIAREANIPIIMAAMDFGERQISFSAPFMVTGNEQADMDTIIQFYAPIRGKKPENDLSHFAKPSN